MDAATGAAAAAGIAFAPREDRREAKIDSHGDGIAPRRTQERGTSARAPRELAPTSTCYVGNLLFDLDLEQLKDEFTPFGNVVNVTISKDGAGLSNG